MDFLSAGASIVGSVLGFMGAQQSNAANIANSKWGLLQSETFNNWQGQIARDYATEMSNTAYQRQVADMQAAGINPMLAITGSGGASTPSVGAASVGQPNFQPMQNPFQSAMSNAKDAATTIAGLRNMEADTTKKGVDTVLSAATADSQSASAAEARARTVTEALKPGLTSAQTQAALSAAGASNASSAASLASAQASSAQAGFTSTQDQFLRKNNAFPGQAGGLFGFTVPQVQSLIGQFKEALPSWLGGGPGSPAPAGPPPSSAKGFSDWMGQ